MNSGDTIFHKIIRREIPADIVYEDDTAIAFRDISPQAPVHILIIPKQTIRSLREMTAAESGIVGHLLLIASQLAHKFGLNESGYRVVTNAGEHAGQSVFQLHFHLLGGRDFSWPPG